jgi:hypothetical protein
MGETQEHLTTWEAAGIIDAATADRIRAYESSSPTAAGNARTESPIAAMFGPSLTIGEVFSYLGAIFVLAASDAFLAKIAGPAPSNDWTLAIGTAIQTVVLLAIGQQLRSGDRRRSRAAGVMFLTATVHAGVTGGLAAGALGLDWPASAVVGSVLALLVGIGVRVVHPGLLTQAAVLGAITSLAASILELVQQTLFPSPDFSFGEPIVQPGPDPLILVLGSAVWWLATAVIIGLIGLREATRSAGDPAAARRAGISRFWAGIVAVVGFASAVTRSDAMANGEYGRVIEPWVADMAILVLAAVLIQRAFRRDDSAFVYPAALALIIALTDFNVTYLGGATEVGLLVEGLILLAVGFGAQRIRRMIGGGGEGDAPSGDGRDAEAPPPTVPVPPQEVRPEA